MALIWADVVGRFPSGTTGWSDFSTDNAEVTANFTTTLTVTTSGGRFGDTGHLVQSISTRYFSVDMTSAGTTQIAGCMIRRSSLISGTAKELIASYTTATGASYNWKLQIGSEGRLYFLAANNAIVGSSPAWCVLGENVWNTVEVKVLHNNGAGTAEVRVNGVTVINVSGIDTYYLTTGPASYMRFMGTSTYIDFEWFYCADTTGSTFNDFLGDFRWELEIVTGDGATANWTPLSGANYTNLDEALGAYDDDTTYISSSTTDQDNYVTMNGLTLTNMNSVLFVQHLALARTDGSDSIAMLTLSSATTDQDADYALTTSYQWVKQYEEVDPNTTSAWASASAINAAEWGVRFRP